jgi:2-octaprenyl-6-methoxyphenol hydroxylase
MLHFFGLQVNRKSIFDVIIIGGGISGLLCAIALKQSGLSIALVEKRCLSSIGNADIRSLAIAPSSVEFLMALGIWQHIEHEAGMIKNIRVLDNHSPFFLDFGDKTLHQTHLGYIIEGFKLHQCLVKHVCDDHHIHIIDNDEVVDCANTQSGDAKIHLASGEILHASLVIAADGKFSKIRDILQIKSYDYDYKQTVMVALCKHQKDHHNWAIEHFMPSGPFAILPLADRKKSGIVWTEKHNLAKLYCAMPRKEFDYFLNQKFTDYLGKVTLEGDVRSYPLSLKFATQYYSGKFVLIGDAAHAIHPLAGQGLNLSLRDIKLLVDLVSRNYDLGLDIGDALLLSEYQRTRLLDNSLMLLMTHGLDTLFSNDYTLLKPIRKLGLSFVNNLSGIKNFLMLKAMGKNYKDLK